MLALLRHDVASTNIELVEYLIEELDVPVAQAWAAVRRRHAAGRDAAPFEAADPA